MKKTKKVAKAVAPKGKNEIRVLIAYKGRLFPFSIVKPASAKFVKMSEESAGCGGRIGAYFSLMIKETQSAIREMLEASKRDEAKDRMRWGFKIKTLKEGEGHALYGIEDDPLGNDGQ